MINFNYICIQQLNDSIKKIIFLNIFFTFGLSLIRKLSVPCFTGHNSRVKRHRDLKASHGAMGLIAWGVLLPFGAIIPRYFKHHDPQWFYLHISIQIVGFLLGLATVLVGTILYSGLDSNRTPRLKIHRPIGSLAFFLSILQVCFRSGLGLSSKYISSSILKTKCFFFAGNGIDSKAGQGIQMAQVLELVPSLGRETCSLLGRSEYCDWNLGCRSRVFVEDNIWVFCNLHSSDSRRFGSVLGAGEIQEGRCESCFWIQLGFLFMCLQTAPLLGP